MFKKFDFLQFLFRTHLNNTIFAQMTLNEIATGESAIITSLLNNEFTLKLVEIGFYENKMLTVEAKSLGSDPICVSLGNSKIMLREKEAKGVIVRRCDNLTM